MPWFNQRIVIGLSVVTALVGCGDSEPESARESARIGASSTEDGNFSSPTTIISLDREKGYETLQELWLDSELLVRGVAGGSQPKPTKEGELGFPTTIVDFRVSELLTSMPAAPQLGSGETIAIHQVGGVDQPLEDMIPIMKEGSEYVLFVDRLEYAPGEPTGDYVITGAAGAYGSDRKGHLRRLDPASTALPSEITEEALVEELTDGSAPR